MQRPKRIKFWTWNQTDLFFSNQMSGFLYSRIAFVCISISDCEHSSKHTVRLGITNLVQHISVSFIQILYLRSNCDTACKPNTCVYVLHSTVTIKMNFSFFSWNRTLLQYFTLLYEVLSDFFVLSRTSIPWTCTFHCLLFTNANVIFDTFNIEVSYLKRYTFNF